MELPSGFRTTPQSRPIYENLLKRIRTVVPANVGFTESKRVIQLITDAHFRPSVTASMFRFIKLFDEVHDSKQLTQQYTDAQKQSETKHVDNKPELALPTVKQLLDKRDTLDKHSKDYLIACMYTVIPALRPSAWVKISYAPTDPPNDSNWYDPETKLLYIMKQKSRVAGKIAITIPDRLHELLVYHKGGDISCNSVIYKSLKRTFGVSAVNMRKMWTRYMETLAPDEKDVVRVIMGHTMATSKIYYTK